MRSLCIYCGSSSGNDPAYVECARAVGTELAGRGIEVVYGGAHVGLMGQVADAALAAGGRVIGVIPQQLVRKELAHRQLTALHITSSMHARKAKMAELADGFVALPGGVGTLEEIFEIWTWAQLGLHGKPVGLLNIAGYYDELVRFVDHATSSGFVRPEQRGMLIVEPTISSLLARFESWVPPVVEKWIARDET